jgi:predicted GIY-YIG superfamily endonuclease
MASRRFSHSAIRFHLAHVRSTNLRSWSPAKVAHHSARGATVGPTVSSARATVGKPRYPSLGRCVHRKNYNLFWHWHRGNCHRPARLIRCCLGASGSAFALSGRMSAPKCVVYVLKSEAIPPRYYTGLTSNLSSRLDAHNSGQSPHTARGRPWRLDVAIEFTDERRAVALERYLKSGSGVAFAKRHLR